MAAGSKSWKRLAGWALAACLALPALAQAQAGQAMLCDASRGTAEEIQRCLELRTQANAVDLASALSAEIARKQVEVEVRKRRIVVRLLDQDAFPAESATLRAAAVMALARVRTALAVVPGRVSVEGHTDDVPVATARFRSNWELAASRAAAVLLELTAGGIADPARYQVVGYGQTRPLVANDTAQNRARNRRVEIVIDQAEP